jgi:hypothetical protein
MNTRQRRPDGDRPRRRPRRRASDARTFILIANPCTNAAAITATFLRSNGTTRIRRSPGEPSSRFNIAVSGGGQAPELTNEQFATIITSTEPRSVERSLYTSTPVRTVSSGPGTNSTGTPIMP